MPPDVPEFRILSSDDVGSSSVIRITATDYSANQMTPPVNKVESYEIQPTSAGDSMTDYVKFLSVDDWNSYSYFIFISDLSATQLERENKAQERITTNIMDQMPTDDELTFQWYTPVLQNRSQEVHEWVIVS